MRNPAHQNAKILRSNIALSGLITILTIFLTYSFQKKTDNTQGKIPVESYYKIVRNIDSAHPLIIWKKPGINDIDFKTWLDNHFSDETLLHQTVYCQGCDDQLLQLSGPEALAYLSGKTVSDRSGGTKPKGSGEDGPAFFSVNFKINIPEYNQKEQNGSYKPHEVSSQPNTNNNPPLTIAVFDTGLDPVIINNNNYLATVLPGCFQNSEHGWNFPDNNYNTFDDNTHAHGTIVTGFILEETFKPNLNEVHILPVKAFKKDNPANLFHILCGLAYASKSKVNIVNASFGYYSMGVAEPDSLFREYINYYLTLKNILMICAAGNEDANADMAVADRSSLCRSVNKRNLNINPFYPACFSKDLSNVITVTTVGNNNMVSPRQNFSPEYVNIGVICDEIIGRDYVFKNSTVLSGSVTGSSFATPIVAGKICAHYSYLTQDGFEKTKIIQRMQSISPPLLEINSTLSSAIKNGLVMHK